MTTTASPAASLDWNAIQVGDQLPPLELPITASLIVAGAIASRDFMPVHHDRSFAQSQGSPDIFMNILTDNGLSTRYLTDWAGPGAMLRKLSIRLGVPCYPGSTLTFTGSVEEKSPDGESPRIVKVAFVGANDLGDHIAGTGTLEFLESGSTK
jgi:acyl dehydratase